jgi:hypothetical protein
MDDCRLLCLEEAPKPRLAAAQGQPRTENRAEGKCHWSAQSLEVFARSASDHCRGLVGSDIWIKVSKRSSSDDVKTLLERLRKQLRGGIAKRFRQIAGEYGREFFEVSRNYSQVIAGNGLDLYDLS